MSAASSAAGKVRMLRWEQTSEPEPDLLRCPCCSQWIHSQRKRAAPIFALLHLCWHTPRQSVWLSNHTTLRSFSGLLQPPTELGVCCCTRNPLAAAREKQCPPLCASLQTPEKTARSEPRIALAALCAGSDWRVRKEQLGKLWVCK